MSVVTDVMITPNRVAGVVRYLRRRGSVSEDELQGALSPAALLRADPTMYRSVINACADIGFVRRDEKQWHLAPNAPTEETVRAALEEILTGAGDDDRSQAEVARALAWFLSLDPMRPLALSENWKGQVEAECPGSDSFHLDGIQRCQQFAYWVVYLGFGWRLSGGSGELLLPDPTEVVLRHLQSFVAPNERRPLREVLDALAGRCPVFEGGLIRGEVDAMMDSARARYELSRATSLALTRLEQRHCIALSSEADFPDVVLTWPSPRRYSHLTLLDGCR